MLQRVGGAIGASVLLVVAPLVVALGSPAAAFGSSVLTGPVLAPPLTSPLLQKAPSPTPSATGSANANLGPSIPGSNVCTMSDPVLTEISGIVATADGYAVINDSNVERSREKIFLLDDQCRVTRNVGYPSSAFDPEDLAVAKDGTLWVADVGDNTTLTGGSGNRRSSIALWSLAPGANTPVIHRLAYPDGKARDAEALIIDGNGHPVIITKDPVGEVYTMTQPLPANNANPAPLTRAGWFRPQATGTTNPYGILGTSVVTGAALSPDGKRAVVRTMADAYEFDVTDGSVVDAITGGSTPRITPLPSEPQGEGIAYTRDGTEFVTTSDQPKASPILRYTPYHPAVAPSASPAVQAQAPKNADRSFLDSLSLQDLTRIVIGFGLVGVLMIAVGVFAVIRSRRRRRALLVGGAAATGSASTSGAPTSGAPTSGAPVSDAQDSGASSSDESTSDARNSGGPISDFPAGGEPSSASPGSATPTSGGPVAGRQFSDASGSDGRSSGGPSSAARGSDGPSLDAPSSGSPSVGGAAPAGAEPVPAPVSGVASPVGGPSIKEQASVRGESSPNVTAGARASDSAVPVGDVVPAPARAQRGSGPAAEEAQAPAQTRGAGSSVPSKAAKARKSSKRPQQGGSEGPGSA
ncbi:hypothetical protein ACPPVO_29350 [Dactylosporangium sp. McL0621]|uniref:hypothetical protein n=1 Tax=Dactylosporangium sp. McL0621 TaxID=3415678 RepID=UPI003CECA7EC